MIKLTKLTSETFYLNPHFIERMEETPNTVITLTSDKKIVVLERAEDIKDQMITFYREVYTPLYCLLEKKEESREKKR